MPQLSSRTGHREVGQHNNKTDNNHNKIEVHHSSNRAKTAGPHSAAKVAVNEAKGAAIEAGEVGIHRHRNCRTKCHSKQLADLRLPILIASFTSG